MIKNTLVLLCLVIIANTKNVKPIIAEINPGMQYLGSLINRIEEATT